ncbi:MAG: hypothetical protein H0W62_11550 [Chitinophagales bacterium]|nr:hypothetical protein [Chitinophagales bacterium]
MLFEHKSEPLLPLNQYYFRVIHYLFYSICLISGSLLIGISGYHFLGQLPWLDSFVNASMILGGMGPVDPIRSAPEKWFAGFYALYSGMAFLSTFAVFLAPVLHRFMHRHHLEAKGGSDA